MGPTLPLTDGACCLLGCHSRAQPAAALGILVWGPRTPESLCRSHRSHVLLVAPALALLRARQLLARDCCPRSERKTQRVGRSLGSHLDSCPPPGCGLDSLSLTSPGAEFVPFGLSTAS